MFPEKFDTQASRSTTNHPFWSIGQPKAEKIEPTRSEVLLQLGVLYWRRGDLERSEKLIDKAREVSEKENNIKFLAQCYIGLALIKNSLDKTDDAITAYQQAISITPENFHLQNNLGNLYLKHKKFEQALIAYRQALKVNPKYGRAHFNVAVVLTKLGKFQESIPYFLESISLIENREEKKQALDLLDEAIRALRNQKLDRSTKKTIIRKIKSKDHNDHDEVTWFYFKYDEEITSLNYSSTIEKNIRSLTGISKKEENNAGEEDMTSILPLSPTNNAQDFDLNSIDAYKWNEKGNIHFKNNAYEEAKKAYYKSIEINPNFGQPYNNLGLIYSIQGNCAKAIAHYQKSVELLITDKEKAVAWNGLGDAFRCLKDYENARIAYKNATELDQRVGGANDQTISFEFSEEDKNAEFWNDLGKLFFKAGAYDKAISAFQKAIRLEPHSGESYGQLARALTAQGQYQEAVSLYHKSIDLISNNSEKATVWNRLGDVHRKLNDYDNARKAYQNGTALTDKKNSLLDRTRFSLLSNCAAKG